MQTQTEHCNPTAHAPRVNIRESDVISKVRLTLLFSVSSKCLLFERVTILVGLPFNNNDIDVLTVMCHALL